MINPFLSSMISANHDKVKGFQPIVKALYPLLFLYCRIFFFLQNHTLIPSLMHIFCLKSYFIYNFAYIIKTQILYIIKSDNEVIEGHIVTQQPL